MSVIEIKQEMDEEARYRQIDSIERIIKKESNCDVPVEDLGYNGISMDEINAIKNEMDKGKSNYNNYEEECEDEQTDNGNQCNVCKVIFNSLEELKAHHKLPNINGGGNLNICCVCKKTFRRGDGGLKVHLRIHTGEKPYECDVCKKTFSAQGNMTKHKMYMHTDRRAFACDICPKTFKQFAHLQDHKQHHSDTRPFQCDICYTGFKSKKNLRIHQQSHDKLTNDVRKFTTCPICSKKFTYFQLKMHMRNHEVSFACSECNVGFESFKQHAEHMEQVHSKSVCNECPECKELFAGSKELQAHMREEHIESLPSFQRHKCTECPKVFSKCSNMKRHMKHHTQIEPYKCEYCSKTFKYSDNFKRHLRIHTNYRPYVCDICNKGYTVISSLKEHKIIHTGKKPYGCSICKKFYPMSKLAKYHIRKHHADALGKCSADDFVVTDFDNVDTHREIEMVVPIKTEPEDDPLGDFIEEESVRLEQSVNENCIKPEPFVCV